MMTNLPSLIYTSEKLYGLPIELEIHKRGEETWIILVGLKAKENLLTIDIKEDLFIVPVAPP